MTTVNELFGQQVRTTPERIAVSHQGQSLTYQALDRRANQLAHWLKSRGVGPEVHVALCMHRSADMVTAIVAVTKAGGAYVPIDPMYPEDRIAFMLKDSGARVVVSDVASAPRLPRGTSALVVDRDWPDQEPTTTPVADGGCADQTAYVIYTSGSTGVPKGVCIPHRNVVRLFTSTRRWFGFGRDDVWTMFHSYAFDFSVWEMWGALLHGGRLVLVSHDDSRSPSAFHALLRREKVTVLNQTPSAFRALMAADSQASRLEAVRCIVFGGEALEPTTLERWFARYGDERPQLINMYGITETTVHVSYRPMTTEDARGATGSVVGCPIDDMRIYILDAEGERAEAGVPGEIHVGAEGLARGYLNRPELTAERFLPDPFSERGGARMYRTGDRARYLENGDIEYLGRLDQQVKIRGFRIELGEIESALRAHPAIQDAVVVAPEHPRAGRRLVAFFVSADAISTPSLRRRLAGVLPAHFVPSSFVRVSAIPLTSNGKVDRVALEARTLRDRPDVEAPYRAARTRTEEWLASLWADLLELSEVGVDDDFFELGGHSLMATDITNQIALDHDVTIRIHAFYSDPTVAGLARIIETSAEGREGARP